MWVYFWISFASVFDLFKCPSMLSFRDYDLGGWRIKGCPSPMFQYRKCLGSM